MVDHHFKVHLAYTCVATKRLHMCGMRKIVQVLCVLVTLICTLTHLCRHCRIFRCNAQVTNSHQKLIL